METCSGYRSQAQARVRGPQHRRYLFHEQAQRESGQRGLGARPFLQKTPLASLEDFTKIPPAGAAQPAAARHWPHHPEQLVDLPSNQRSVLILQMQEAQCIPESSALPTLASPSTVPYTTMRIALYNDSQDSASRKYPSPVFLHSAAPSPNDEDVMPPPLLNLCLHDS